MGPGNQLAGGHVVGEMGIECVRHDHFIDRHVGPIRVVRIAVLDEHVGVRTVGLIQVAAQGVGYITTFAGADKCVLFVGVEARRCGIVLIVNDGRFVRHQNAVVQPRRAGQHPGRQSDVAVDIPDPVVGAPRLRGVVHLIFAVEWIIEPQAGLAPGQRIEHVVIDVHL